MTRTSGAWAIAGLRRTTHNLYAYPQNTSYVARNTTSFNAVARQPSPVHTVRRHNATKPLAGQNAPTTATTIPGPSWLWLEPVIEPFRAYGRVQQRRPYLTQLVSSLVIYFVGDLVAQSIVVKEHKEAVEEEEEEVERGWVQQWSEDRDWTRTGRALIIGGISSIPSYRWFLWLSTNFNYSSKILSLSTKVFVNQLFFTPVFNSYFFGMQPLLSGASLDEIVERIKHTVPTSWINSCKLWPAVTAFMFTYIPLQYRSIFGGVIAIGWQTYLNLLNQRAAAQEQLERPAALDEVDEAAAAVKHKAVQEHEEQGSEKQKCAA